MNIQQLKDAIAANPKIIKAYYPPDVGMTDHQDYFFIKLYEQTNGDVANDAAYCIVVKNRGLPAEAIFWKGGLPPSFQTASTAFRVKAEDAIVKYQAAHAELKYYEINSVDETKKVARVTAYELVSALLVAKQYLIYENGAGQIQRYTIST